ncbi:MAG: hypothetical protein EOL86_13450 [Deltaproteobacteria bacterium]|nr:hypothetical protein [Deltaproteobacteria bacterium]
MSMTLEDVELLAFDPPFLGMPAGPCHCGRWEREGEGFVEIFIRVEKERIADVGFLTNIHGEGILCAALCCQTLLEKSVDEARAIDEHDILAVLPPKARTESVQQIAIRCAAAGRKAANGTPAGLSAS